MRNFSQLTSSSTNTNTKLFALTGTASTTEDSATITGSGTAFLSQVRIGDKIKVGTNQYLKVISIASDTELTVEIPYGATASGLALEIIPIECVNGQGRVAIVQHLASGAGVISIGESINASKDGSDVTATSNSYSLVAGQATPPMVTSVQNVYIQCTSASQRYQVILSS